MSRKITITPQQAEEAIRHLTAAQAAYPCHYDEDGCYVSPAAADMVASIVGDDDVRRVLVGDTDVVLACDIWGQPVDRLDIEAALRCAASGDGVAVTEPDDYQDV